MHNPDSSKGRRTIRSFVRRAGRLTPSQQRALDELWPAFGVEFNGEPLDLDALFERQAPRVLEIGFGNGESLVQHAVDNPQLDFIGIEVHEPGIGHCLLRACEAGITNLKILNHDAVDVLAAAIPAASLQRINLYFPDPWPKRRHHKRRIIQQGFLERLYVALRPRGALHIATDWANYAQHIDEVLSTSELFTLVERREHAGDTPLDRPPTKFERRGLKRGHRIVDWHYAKRAKDGQRP
jgi:tRNA (guanine-N7-)-methyltransferase